jgi:hypothetical protein
MIILTARAGALLQRMQSARAGPYAPRLVAGSGGYSIELSAPMQTDGVLYHAETPALYVSAAAVTALDGCILTARELPEGPTLVIMPLPGGADLRNRTLHVGGWPRRSPAIMSLPSTGQYRELQAQTRQLVTNDDHRGVPASSRAFCDACQQPRPASGSAQYGRYALCNACVLEYVLAVAGGAAVSAGQYVRDKAFGETMAYGLPSEPPTRIQPPAAPIRLRLPARMPEEGAVRRNSGVRLRAQRSVIRLPRQAT